METPLHCVDAPAHYKQGEVECVDAMESAFGKDRVATFCTVNAMKYLCDRTSTTMASRLAYARHHGLFTRRYSSHVRLNLPRRA